MIITGSQLARLTGTTRQNIYKLAKTNKLSKLESGKFDTLDKVNSEYLFNHGIDSKELEEKNTNKSSLGLENIIKKDVDITLNLKKSRKKVKKPKKILVESEEENIENEDNLTPEGIEKLLDLPNKCLKMTMEQIVLEFQNIRNLKLYAETLDKQLSAAKKAVEIKKSKSEMIERDFIKSHVLNYLNILSNQLFDYAGENEKMCKDFSKIIQHAQKQLDREFEKLEIIKEAQN